MSIIKRTAAIGARFALANTRPTSTSHPPSPSSAASVPPAGAAGRTAAPTAAARSRPVLDARAVYARMNNPTPMAATSAGKRPRLDHEAIYARMNSLGDADPSDRS